MKKITLKSVIVSVFSLACISINAQNTWREISNNDAPNTSYTSGKTYVTNLDALTTTLTYAPERGNYTGRSNTIVEFPNAQGEMMRYRVEEASVFAPELQEQYPEIRSYAAYGIDDPTAFARFSVSPYKGINGIILSAKKEETLVIEASTSAVNHTRFFTKTSNSKTRSTFVCSTEMEENLAQNLSESIHANRSGSDGILRTFDLAMSVSGEYSQYHGGTLPQVNAAIATTLTRVNGVFENDFNVTMVLVASNDNVVYLNPGTDPYSGTSDGMYSPTLQSTLDANIGAANYDVGHLMAGIGNNGFAGCIGCICVNGVKGSGYTTSTVPGGVNFDIDFVAHEMGHQFGANHTFSFFSEGGIAQMEPGSGSTIMGYAGITGATDLQSNSDPYFHAISILQVTNHVASRPCDIQTDTGNNAPVVDAGTNMTLPIGTPFMLIGSATDADGGDVLTYCWEQFDENDGLTAYPNENLANSNEPLFRSFSPTEIPNRTFPRLEDLLVYGVNGTTWEKIPVVSRSADFRLTVRDNRPGGATTNFDDVMVTWDATKGPFTVTSQNTAGIIWNNGNTETISWDVNDTNTLAGASNVDILLSLDGGLTYTEVLAANTPNDGSEDIIVPNTPAPYCRVMVKPSGATFFAINTIDFSIDYEVSVTCNQYASGAINLAIPDGAGANSPGSPVFDFIEVSDSFTVSDVRVNVDISHTYINDLVIQVQHPGGDDFTNVWARNCGGENNLDIIFDDNAPDIVCAQPTTGTYAPANPLSVFNGLQANGNWAIAVVDFYNDDSGILNDWYLEFCVTTETPLSVNENTFAGFTVFPNPNSGMFTVKFNATYSNDVTIEVFDLRGRTIYSKVFSDTGLEFNQTIDLRNAQSGIYLVKAMDGTREITKKIIID